MIVQAECTTPEPMDSEINTERGFPLDTNFGIRCDQGTEKEAQQLASGTIPQAPARLLLLSTEQKRGGFSFLL